MSPEEPFETQGGAEETEEFAVLYPELLRLLFPPCFKFFVGPQNG